MLRSKLVVYGDQERPKVPAHLHYGQYMLQKFRQFGDDTALINSITGETLTYSAMAQLVVDVSLSLTRAGVGKGDVVAICCKERMEYIATVFGVICSGAACTAIHNIEKASIAHRLRLSKPKLIFCSMETYEYADIFRAAGVETIVVFDVDDQRRNDAVTFKEFLTEHAMLEDFVPVPVDGTRDVAMIKYSSGTTGMPKGVLMTHMNLLVNARIDFSLDRGERILVSPEFLQFSFTCLHAGAVLVFQKEKKARLYMEAVHKFKIEIIQALPSLLLQILKESSLQHQRYDVTSVRRVVTGTSSFDAHLYRRVKNRFPEAVVHQFYGCTEFGVICTDESAPFGVRPGSVGCVLPGLVVKVVDLQTGEMLGPHQRGELCVQGGNMFKGYIGLSNEHLDSEGFYRTGDVAYYDEDRYFYIVDRIKDIIKRNSWTVCPAELEALLRSHPAVYEAAVIGVPHPQLQEAALAFVVKQSAVEVTGDELVTFVNAQVPEWMSLNGVRFIPSIPRGERGKINRKALREVAKDLQ